VHLPSFHNDAALPPTPPLPHTNSHSCDKYTMIENMGCCIASSSSASSSSSFSSNKKSQLRQVHDDENKDCCDVTSSVAIGEPADRKQPHWEVLGEILNNCYLPVSRQANYFLIYLVQLCHVDQVINTIETVGIPNGQPDHKPLALTLRVMSMFPSNL